MALGDVPAQLFEETGRFERRMSAYRPDREMRAAGEAAKPTRVARSECGFERFNHLLGGGQEGRVGR